MSSRPIDTPGPTPEHPVVDFAQRLCTRLEALAETPLMSLTPAEKRDLLVSLTTSTNQLATLTLRLLAEAEASEATADSGARSAADWVAVKTRQVRRDARSDLKLAQRLEDHRLLTAAMGHGRVNLAQARAITAALARLPMKGEFAVTDDQRELAEAHLVKLAATHDAKELRVLGRRIFEVIAPDLAEKFEGQALAAEEAEAERRTSFVMWEDDQGIAHVRFKIPARYGQMLEKAILALTSPSRSVGLNTTGIDPDLPTPVRQGIAFTQIIETLRAEDLPKIGGCSATVMVTMSLEQLLAELDAAGVATMDTGGRISAAEARRMACEAGIIPMVLDGKSQPLDVGRKRRLHTEAMRIAMGVRDGGCTAEGCQTPPGMCHAHHDDPWAAGGRTCVKDGRLLCPHHHRKVHDPRFTTELLPNGKLRFHRRE